MTIPPLEERWRWSPADGTQVVTQYTTRMTIAV